MILLKINFSKLYLSLMQSAWIAKSLLHAWKLSIQHNYLDNSCLLYKPQPIQLHASTIPLINMGPNISQCLCSLTLCKKNVLISSVNNYTTYR